MKTLFGGESMAGTSRRAIPEGFEKLGAPSRDETTRDGAPSFNEPSPANPAEGGFLPRGWWRDEQQPEGTV